MIFTEVISLYFVHKQKIKNCMFQRIIKIPILVLLVLMPVLSSMLLLGKHSPYFDGNSFSMYNFLNLLNALVSMLLLWIVINKELPKQILRGGILLFFIGIAMASIAGLAAPPDFTAEILKHPEREKYRYALLFLNALLFAGAFILIRQPGFSNWNKWLLLLFIPAMAEMFWEFYHHFYYADNMKSWIDSGKNADKFMDHYSGGAALKAGAVGRFFQYSCIALLSYVLHMYSYIRKWSLAPLFLLCGMGIFSAVYVFLYGFNLAGPFAALMIFFIPAGPFILLYWIGVALLTKPSGK